MDILVPSFRMMSLSRIREYLLTRPWGVLMNPITLSRIFELIDREKATKSSLVKQVKVGSEVKLLDRHTSTVSKIVLADPKDSNPSLGKISYLSLLGSELLGAIPGEKVSVDILGRSCDFQVLGVKEAPLNNRR